MSIELQTSDLRSRIIQRTTPSVIPVSENVHFEIPEPGTLIRISPDGKTVFEASEIRKDGFFRAHNIPDGSRWIRNKHPHSLWDFFVKEQIVFVPNQAALSTQEPALAPQNG